MPETPCWLSSQNGFVIWNKILKILLHCRFPILDIDEDERIIQLEDGTLQIDQLTQEDATTYTCRAYNGVGDGDTREYSLRVQGKLTPLVGPTAM